MNNVSRDPKHRQFFSYGNKVFHKRYGIGIVRGSWHGHIYLVDWYTGESTRNTAQTLKLISESDDSYYYIDVVNNIKNDLKAFLDNSFFVSDNDAFNYVFEVYNPDVNYPINSVGWFEVWIAIGLLGLESRLISNEVLEKLSNIINNYSIYDFENDYEKEEFQIIREDYENVKCKIINNHRDGFE
jgi:hypothetical protein